MPRRPPTTKRQREFALSQPCPTCGAKAGENCTRPRGVKARPHVARIPATLPPDLT